MAYLVSDDRFEGVYKMRKGITPVIAIIVLLLITVALAGATWTYLSAYWQGIVGKNVQVMDSYCVAGTNGVILVRNTGTLSLSGTAVSAVDPGVVVKYNMSCRGLCLFRFLVGGRTMTASVQC